MMRPACIKSCHSRAGTICPNWELRLIAVGKWFLHAYNWLHNTVCKSPFKPSNAYQILPDLLLLKRKLALVTHMLKLAAAAGAGIYTTGLHPVR